ncbi:MAG: FtsX-like permease family protein, partial [Bacteroidota bacterium]
TGGEREMRNIYIPITTAQKVYAGTDEIHQLMFTGGDLTVDQMDDLEERVRASFAVRKQFDINDRRAVGMFNLAKEYQSFMSLFAAINGIIWIVGIFSIIAGVIGVSNIMLIIVKDRTKEIGIRKSLGATPRSIISMILMEAIVITSVAGYVGLLGGVGFTALVSKFVEHEFFYNPQVNITVAILAVVILIISGVIAGLIPALRAASINPVIAMKSD